MRREWVSYMRKDEPGNMHDYYSEVPIKTNDVLIFPGWMSHRAQPSKSNEERLVFTLNYFAQ